MKTKDLKLKDRVYVDYSNCGAFIEADVIGVYDDDVLIRLAYGDKKIKLSNYEWYPVQQKENPIIKFINGLV